jgi:1-acyl-sn-glycerol-3-phosphate acyltransferase
VLLTHDNLLANVRAIGAAVDVRPTDVGASWLPLYHDMGLIGTWLFCLHFGVPLVLMSPLAFLSRPERWLWAIHERRATLSPAPNFAYELCVRKVPDRALEDLDLSSWRLAFNGAEPVQPETLERFYGRFARCGFRREALLPVYGLAENSVALCVPPLDRGPKYDRVAREPFESAGRAEPADPQATDALEFVSVGVPIPEHEVRLVDEAGADVPDRTVGRLAFRGPSMMSGYFRQPEATAAITLPGGWLDSGDLAYRAEGEIHVAGRRKDLIIKGGRNLVPHEIEEVASSVEGIRKGCVVAFGLARADLGTESLVVVAETRAHDAAERDRLVAAVTEKVATAIGLPPDVVALVPPGAVPKTSSGKIRRSATRDMYQREELGRTPGTSFATRARVVAGSVGSALHARLLAIPRGLYAIWLALVIAGLVAVVWVPIALVPGRRLAWRLSRAGARALLFLAGCRTSAEGLERLPPPGSVLLASNHSSYADVIALLAILPREFAFVAKQEVLGWPIVGRVTRRAEHVTVERFDVARSVADMTKVARALEERRWVLLFPEGTFTRTAGLRPFRLGTFKTAVETGTPVVPVALRGTRAILRGEDRLPRPGRVHLWVGAPIAPEGEGWRAVVALRDRVAEAIAVHTGEPRLDLVAGGPERA